MLNNLQDYLNKEGALTISRFLYELVEFQTVETTSDSV